MKNIKIFQIYFDKSQRLDKGFIPVFNEHGDKYLETSVIKKLWESGEHIGCDFFGVVSYKFEKKTRLRSGDIDFHLNRHDADIYTFFGHTKAYQEWQPLNLWKRDKIWHPNLYDIGVKIFDKLGYDIRELLMPVIYYNYWITSPVILDEYMNEVLLPAMELMENDKEIKDLCMQDAKYPHAIKDNKRLYEVFGRPFYTYHPFVCERLFPTFVALKNKYKISNLR